MNGRNFAIAGGIIAAGAAAVIIGLGINGSPDWGLHIAILSVGQADAIAIVSSNGQACIIDAGNSAADGDRIARFLRDESENGVGEITDVKLAFATHYDQDHIGGFKALRDAGITFKSIYDQGPSIKRNAGNTAYGRYLQASGDPNGNMIQDTTENEYVRKLAKVGLHWKLGEARVKCLSARGDTKGSAFDFSNLDPASDTVDENPGSVAIIITLGDFEFYTAGDQTSDDWKNEPDTEIKIVESGVLGTDNDIDVLKVSHHGSDTSTGKDFIAALDPEVAVISVEHTNHNLPKMISIKQLVENMAIVYVTGDGFDPATGMFPYSNSTAEDDNFVPDISSYINNAGDVHIYVSTDGFRYKVVANGQWKEFSAVDSDNIHGPVI